MGLVNVENEKAKNTTQIQQNFFDYLKKVNYNGTFGIAKFSTVFNDLMPVQQEKLKEKLNEHLNEFMDKGSMISVGIFYPAEVIDCINVQKNGVTDIERWDLYSDEYQHINEMLMEVSNELAQKYNGIAFPPTTETMAKSINSVIEFYPHTISHRVVAEHASVGWRGKNELIITETHGPTVRFTSILVNIPLNQNNKIESKCGGCTACLDVCSILRNKEKLKDYRENCNNFLNSLGLKHHVCGKCIKACFQKSIFKESFRLHE